MLSRSRVERAKKVNARHRQHLVEVQRMSSLPSSAFVQGTDRGRRRLGRKPEAAKCELQGRDGSEIAT